MVVIALTTRAEARKNSSLRALIFSLTSSQTLKAWAIVPMKNNCTSAAQTMLSPIAVRPLSPK